MVPDPKVIYEVIYIEYSSTFDPITGLQVDPLTGLAVNPAAGIPVSLEPGTLGLSINPLTDQAVSPITGALVNTTAFTGMANPFNPADPFGIFGASFDSAGV